MASRADAPGGLGYALENRLVVAQTFPESFGDMQVARLAAFFNAYRESILGLGASRRDRAVLLTPGPYNEAYFEHVYLAHYLGLTLVQGDDLAVRDGGVFLKTLTGLEKVAAIFRRVDSDFCDPLEFRGDSALGVPGLTEAVRAGSVVLANALGGGVIESPVMDAYLPQYRARAPGRGSQDSRTSTRSGAAQNGAGRKRWRGWTIPFCATPSMRARCSRANPPPGWARTWAKRNANA